MRRLFALVAMLMVLPWAAAGAAPAPGAPGSGLGGYRVSSGSSGLELAYNDGSQVDLTIPSATTSGSTGSGHALSAPLYPGSVGGNPGATIKQFLGSHLPPQLADQLGTLTDPLKAEAYASGPNDSAFPPGAGGLPALVDTAHADKDGGHMTAAGTFANVGGLKGEASSVTDVTSGKVTTTATSTISDLSIAGMVHIGQVVSTATASSDGTAGAAKGSTTVAALSVAGLNVSLQPASLTLGTAKVPLDLGGLLNPVIKALGLTITISPETHKVDGIKALEHAPALTISVAPPGNAGNTFLVTVGGALAQAQASPPFSAPSGDGIGGGLGSGLGPSLGSATPPSGTGDTSGGSVPNAPSGTTGTGEGSTGGSLPPAQAIAGIPAASEKSKALPVGLVVFGLLVGGAAAFGLGKVRDDVLAEKAGGRCPLERNDG